MDSFNDEILLNFFKELTKFTKRKDALVGIVCGIKDEDIEEFTNYIKSEENKDEHILLDDFIKFCDEKNYEMDQLNDTPNLPYRSTRTTSKSITIAVTFMYSTDYLNKPGTTVLYGHNYKNSLLFSRLDQLSNGDEVIITDKEGEKITYVVYKNKTTTSTDTSDYSRDSKNTKGKKEIMLVTCTDDADMTDKRYWVYCKEK